MNAGEHIHIPTVPVDLKAGGQTADLVRGEIHRCGIAICRVCKRSFEFVVRQTIPPTGHTAGKAYW